MVKICSALCSDSDSVLLRLHFLPAGYRLDRGIISLFPDTDLVKTRKTAGIPAIWPGILRFFISSFLFLRLFFLFYFYQFNLEVQLLACHLMVGIEGDGLLVLGCHLYREGLAELIGQIYALTYL